MLKLIVDENIAFADKAFNQFGNVTLLPGREITNSILKDADVLIVRSITNVNEELLKNTNVKFVGTATIGTDHIDVEYLKKNNIAFADAKGCNAYSVAEYVIAALLNLAVKFDLQLSDKSIGIVGVGNVGSKVARFAEALGMKVLLNDPPLQRFYENSKAVISKDPECFRDEKSVPSIRLLSRSEIGIEVTNTIITKPLQRSGDLRNFVVLDDIYKCDIITLHTPLNLYGRDKTYHLFNNHNLSKLKDGAVLINTSRGAVINNLDLLNSIEKKKLKVVLDVWENEPDINVDLLKAVLIATPHIAGYSYEGKVNGTKMIYDSLCKFLDEEKVFSFNMPYEGELKVILKNTEYFMDEKFVKDIRLPPLIEVTDKIENGLEKLISNIYSINDDDERMRKMLAMNKREKIKYFDSQRKNYPMRREFNNYSVKSDNLSEDVKNILERLRFNLA